MNLISKIHFHPLFYLFTIICILTGLFKEFLIFMMIIIIHELGHIVAGLILKQKIERIIILPFGGLTIFKMLLNIKIYKELIIALSGPMIQIISFLLLKNSITNYYFCHYNIIILIFNLLPIYPLDGSKILNLLCNKIFCFKYSFYITFTISFFVTILLFFILSKYSLILLIICFFLNYKAIIEIVNYKNIYNKFLLERYNNNFFFKRKKYIKSIYKMYRDKIHLIKDSERWFTEREILRKRFDFKRNIC